MLLTEGLLQALRQPGSGAVNRKHLNPGHGLEQRQGARQQADRNEHDQTFLGYVFQELCLSSHALLSVHLPEVHSHNLTGTIVQSRPARKL